MSGLKTTPGLDYFISSLSFNFYLKLLDHLYIHGSILWVLIDWLILSKISVPAYFIKQYLLMLAMRSSLVNLTNWIEEVPLSCWPISMPVGHFLDCFLICLVLIVLGGGHVIVRGSILRQEGLGYKRRVDEQVKESKPVINAPLRSLALTLSSLMMDNNLNDEINPFFLSLVLPTL